MAPSIVAQVKKAYSQGVHAFIICSAAPKPGNTYYAYDFDFITRGWGLTMVNTADWAPAPGTKG